MTYFIIYLIGLALGLAYAGFDHERGGWCTWQEQVPLMVAAVIWPVIAVVLAIVLPFRLPVLIGQWIGRRL